MAEQQQLDANDPIAKALESTTQTMGQSGTSDSAKVAARGAFDQGRQSIGALDDAREGLFGEGSQVQKDVNSARTAADDAETLIKDKLEPAIEQARVQHDAATEKYQEALNANVSNRVKIADQMNAMDEMSKQIAAGGVNDVWGNANVGVKIGALITAALGGAAQAMSGSGSNAAVDLMNQEIQRAIMIQRMRLEKNKDDYAMRNTLLGRMMAHTDNVEDAAQKAFVTAHQGIAGRIDALKALSSSAQIRAQLDNVKAQLSIKSAQANMQALENTVGQAVGLSEHAANTEASMGKSSSTVGQGIKLAEEMRKTQALRDREQNRETDRTLLGYVPTKENPGAGPVGETKTVTQVRNAIASHATADGALGELYKSIGANRLSKDGWDRVNQDLSKVTLTLKSGQALNMGANFTEMERQLIEKGVLGRRDGVLTIIDHKGAQKAIANFAAFWRKQLSDSAASIGMEKAKQ